MFGKKLVGPFITVPKLVAGGWIHASHLHCMTRHDTTRQYMTYMSRVYDMYIIIYIYMCHIDIECMYVCICMHV